MTLHYPLGVLVYAIAVSICYVPSVKDGPYYFPIGIACGMLANAIWLHLARQFETPEKVLVAGFYWDSMIVAMYALIPIVFFGVRFTWTAGIGMLLIVGGIVLTKV